MGGGGLVLGVSRRKIKTDDGRQRWRKAEVDGFKNLSKGENKEVSAGHRAGQIPVQ